MPTSFHLSWNSSLISHMMLQSPGYWKHQSINKQRNQRDHDELSLWLGRLRQEMLTEFWWEILLGTAHLEDHEGDRTTLTRWWRLTRILVLPQWPALHIKGKEFLFSHTSISHSLVPSVCETESFLLVAQRSEKTHRCVYSIFSIAFCFHCVKNKCYKNDFLTNYR